MVMGASTSTSTVYEWRRRDRAEGLAGYLDRESRPKASLRRTPDGRTPDGRTPGEGAAKVMARAQQNPERRAKEFPHR